MSKRLVFVQSGLGAGGAEKIINLIAQHRARLGDEVFVLAFHDSPDSSFFQYPPSVVLRTMQSEISAPVAGGQGFLRQVRWLRKTIAEIQPERVVSFLTKINAISAIALLGTAPHLIVSERNNPLKQRPGRLWKGLISFTFNRADCIVMQTGSAQKLLNRAARAKSCVIANPCIMVPPVGSETSKQVIAVGRLTQQKGFDLLIDAFAAVLSKHPDAGLTIWGEGQDRAKLEKRINDKGLNSNIFLPGLSDGTQAWVDQNAIFVLSSLYEGFPNVLAEAMSAGLACVAFDCDWGPSDLIENGVNGLLVRTGDRDSLSQAITSLLDSPEHRKTLGVNARKNAEKYALDTILQQWDLAIDGGSNG